MNYRWPLASKKECGGVCTPPPCATLNTTGCMLYFDTNVCASGFWAVSVELEDFRAGSSTPMSAVGLQFLVNVQSITIKCLVA